MHYIIAIVTSRQGAVAPWCNVTKSQSI